MYPPDREQYASFLTREWGSTSYVEFRAEEQLLAVAVLDRLENGLSAIYTYFDPAPTQRSLGSFVILWPNERARDLGLAAGIPRQWGRGYANTKKHNPNLDPSKK